MGGGEDSAVSTCLQTLFHPFENTGLCEVDVGAVVAFLASFHLSTQ
jgi:hypothetical protein